MESQYHKNEFKREIKGMNVNQLQKILQQLELEKVKLGTEMRLKEGSSTLVRNYPKEKQTRRFGNYKNVTKDIARVKTLLHVKLKRGQNGR